MSGPPAARLRIVSFTTVFPNQAEPSLGSFVRTRLEHLAKLADVTVVSPIAWITYAGFPRRLLKLRRSGAMPSGTLPVIQPRWFYPPFAGAINGVFLFLQALPAMQRLWKSRPFDIIDAHFAHPDGTAAALLAAWFHIPFTVTLRGVEAEHARHRIRRAAMAWTLMRAARVICVSERLRGLALSLGVPEKRALTIPNGIDADIFFPRDRQECRQRLGLPGKGSIILTAGHLIELKGHHRIIQSVRGLLDSGITVRLIIAGGAGRRENYEPRLRACIAQLKLENVVSFVGEVKPHELAELMSAADIFCLASSREGWPNVVHEALGCGTPVVATNVGAVPEMLPSEMYGVIVPPNDVSALQAGLRKALHGAWDRRAISEWGRARSWEHVARELHQELWKAVRR